MTVEGGGRADAQHGEQELVVLAGGDPQQRQDVHLRQGVDDGDDVCEQLDCDTGGVEAHVGAVHGHASPQGVSPLVHGRARISTENQFVLYITTASFFLFVIAEIIGALASGSLSLLGDAAAMSVDVLTYLCSIWVERIKSRGEELTETTRLVTEVYVPGLSVLALLGVTAWVTSDAIVIILTNADDTDEVDVRFLYGFACANFLVDLVSSYMFYRNKGVFAESVVLEEEHYPGSLDLSESQSTPVALKDKVNINMASAFTHVGGDTLRTAAIFFAALISTTANLSGSICDAWATVIVATTIVFLVIPLVKEIIMAWNKRPDEASPVERPDEASPVERPDEASPVERPDEASPVERTSGDLETSSV